MPQRSRSYSRTVSPSAVRSRTPPRRGSFAQADLLKQRGELLGARDNFDAKLPTPRRTQRRLGVQLKKVANDKLVVASAADENDVVRPGCVAEWNKLHNVIDQSKAKLRIQPGDRITAVNHCGDYDSMLTQLDQAPRMILSIERDRPGVMKPVPRGLMSRNRRSHSISSDCCTGQDQSDVPQKPPEEVPNGRKLLPPLPLKTQFESESDRPSSSDGSTSAGSSIPSGKASPGSGTSPSGTSSPGVIRVVEQLNLINSARMLSYRLSQFQK